MAIVACGHCGKRLRVEDELLGGKAKCPACGLETLLAAEEPEPAAVTQTVPDPRIRRLERQNRWLWVAAAVTLLVAIGGLFAPVGLPARVEKSQRPAAGQVIDVEKFEALRKEASEVIAEMRDRNEAGGIVLTKKSRVGIFDSLKTKTLEVELINVVDAEGRQRMIMGCGIDKYEGMAVFSILAADKKAVRYWLSVQDGVVEESFRDVAGKRRIMIAVNSKNDALVSVLDESETPRVLMVSLKDGEAGSVVYDSKGDAFEEIISE